jgi:hypothetical protein
VYRGRIVDELKRLNDNSQWRGILGIKGGDKNQKDVEIILRLFSLFEVWQNYEKPMLRYLNNQMNLNRPFDTPRATKFVERFPRVVDLVSRNLVKPFRPRSVINAAMLEGVMIALLENPFITDERLKRNYAVLAVDPIFEKFLRGATTDTATVRDRIKRAKEVLADG